MVVSGDDYLLFELASRRWALPLADVREVVRAVLPLALPEAPAAVDGVIDLRGELVAVLDPRVRLGEARCPVRASEHFVVARAGARAVALRVDRVLEVVRLPGGAISPEAFGAGAWIAGTVRLDDGLVLLQDLGRFLTDPEAAALGRALARAAEGG